MTTEQKSVPPIAAQPSPVKKPAEMDPAEWYADFTSRDDVKEILSRLAK